VVEGGEKGNGEKKQSSSILFISLGRDFQVTM